MEISLAKPEQLPELVRLYTACMRAMRAAGIEQWGEDYPTADIIKQDVDRGEMHVLGEQNGAIVAAICLNEDQNELYSTVEWTDAAPVLVVHRLCVAPERQRNGIAARMMDFAEERAWQEGYAGIRLDTYSGNPPAVRLYERRGYRRTGEVFFRGRPLPFFCFEKIFPATR